MKKLSFMLALAVLTFGFIATVTSCSNSLSETDLSFLSADRYNKSLESWINIKFNVKNGGWGLIESHGLVDWVDNEFFPDSGGATFASDFSISAVGRHVILGVPENSTLKANAILL